MPILPKSPRLPRLTAGTADFAGNAKIDDMVGRDCLTILLNLPRLPLLTKLTRLPKILSSLILPKFPILPRLPKLTMLPAEVTSRICLLRLPAETANFANIARQTSKKAGIGDAGS